MKKSNIVPKENADTNKVLTIPEGKKICPDCKGHVGPQLVDIGGVYIDAKCVTCDGTGLIDA